MNHQSEIHEIYNFLLAHNKSASKFSYNDIAEICYHTDCFDAICIDLDQWSIYETLEDACKDLANGDGYFESDFYTKESPSYKREICSDVMMALDYTVLYVPDEKDGHYLISIEDECDD